MSSKLEIYNLALHHLKMRPITATSDTTPSGVACNAFYDIALADTLGETAWGFATVQESLSEVDTSTWTEELLGWDFAYTYPEHSLRVWTVFDESTVKTRDEQLFEEIYYSNSAARFIVTDLASAYAEYTWNVTDTTKFDAKFVLALSYKLASLMAHELTGNLEVSKQMTAVYQNVLSEAKRLNFSGKNKKPDVTSSYKNARA